MTTQLHRLHTVSTELVDFVDAIAAGDEPRRLLLIAVASVDATGVGADQDVAELLAQWRNAGCVEERLRRRIIQKAERAEAEAIDDQLSDAEQDRAFNRARAFSCIHFATSTNTDRLRETAYEASFALQGPQGVEQILRGYSG